ncbi:MAG: hypothetical protein O2958_11570 [Gemmatimonadetes bacterium]|nr:hypothetical protein [Gemmatimonadota bacterium]
MRTVLVTLLGMGAAVGIPVGAEAQEGPAPLFASHEILDLTLTADFAALRGDRRASPDRAALITAPDAGGGTIDVGAELRTRGEFRLDPANCSFPPLRIDVDASTAKETVFEGQDKLKLVSSCRPGRDSYEDLVLTEYLAYRTYQLLSSQSFHARLLRLTFVDTGRENAPETRIGFLIEEDNALAARLGATIFDLEEGKNLLPATFDPTSLMMVGIFQYMIGNTDWSDVAGHNFEIVDRGGAALVVPYDFDIAGIVDAPYATPDPVYGLASVRDRLYRGWCGNSFNTHLVLERFREASTEITKLWTDVPGLTEATRRRTVSYLADFFESIETDERADRRFLRDCRIRPTG